MSALRDLARALVPRPWRNWLRSPAASTAWMLDELLHRAGRDRTVEIRPGWLLVCHPAAYRVAYWVHQRDPEQTAELDAFIRACRSGMVLFDVGAHFGLFSLAGAHYGGATSRAIAFEPSPSACRMLVVEAKLNDVARQVTVLEAAAGAREGFVELVAVGVIAGGYYSGTVGGYDARDLTRTHAVTLDGTAQSLGLWPTHVKIDVEGFEADVLEGAHAVLERRPAPHLFLELHTGMVRERGEDPERSLALLRGAGYRLYSLDDRLLADAEVLSRPLVRCQALWTP